MTIYMHDDDTHAYTLIIGVEGGGHVRYASEDEWTTVDRRVGGWLRFPAIGADVEPTASPFPPMHPTPWSYSEAELDTCPKS